jgi:uncharacterized membrane protein
MSWVARTATTEEVTGGSVETDAKRPRPVRPGRYSLPGLVGALAFVCLSLSPSLLPRTGLIQGLVCGITGAIGYGIGVVVAWVWRAFVDRDPRPTRRRSWQILAVVAAVCLVSAMGIGRYWQGQIRVLLGMPPDGLASLVVTPLVAILVLVALIALARGLRRAYRWTARWLEQWIGPRAARAVGWTTVVGGTALLISGVLLDGLVAAADAAFSLRNGTTEAGVVQPTAPERSGSSQSRVSWTSLGQQGRSFTGTGPSAEQIAAFGGGPARTPIRAYAGLESAPAPPSSAPGSPSTTSPGRAGSTAARWWW